MKSSLFKYTTCIAIAAVSLEAQALDFTPDPTRNYSDPAGLPTKGEFVGSTSYTYTNTSADVDSQGAPGHSYSTGSNSLSQTASYGLTDNFTLMLLESYDWADTSNHFANGSSNSMSAYGFVDPAFGFTWRALDQKAAPVNFDIFASFAPNLINAEGASPIHNGTMASGGRTADFGAAVSYRTRDFSIYGSGSAIYLGDSVVSNPDGTDTSYGSNWQYKLAVTTQTRFTDFSVNLGLAEIFNQSANATNDTTRTTFTNTPGNETSLNASLNHEFIPGHLVGSLTYAHDFYSGSSMNFPATPASNTSTKNQSDDVFGAELTYELH